MKDQKAENLLNLALSVPEEERKQTGELDVGYDRETLDDPGRRQNYLSLIHI